MENASDAALTAGLCASCAHARVIASSRGSTFYFCELSLSDARFPKYPRLPILACAGYSVAPGTDAPGHAPLRRKKGGA
jgi:hypothetical protein